MADQTTFLPIIEGVKIERTQATYYTSEVYPNPLTPEHILGCQDYRSIKRGQIPYPQNRWSAFDAWYLCNHWIHRMGDKYVFGLFGWFMNGLHDTTIDDQPSKKNFMTRTKPYDDDIVGQVAGAVCAGVQLGCLFGIMHTQNYASEAMIFQSAAMPMNRWLPISKATRAFKSRIMFTCMLQCSSFFATYALVDGIMSKTRGTDDMWNTMLGGIGAGGMLYLWFNKPFNTVPAGLYFGMLMTWFRFVVVPDNCPKLALDFNRPGYGVFGGFPMWLANEEPNPENIWYYWVNKKYWPLSP